MTRHLKTTLLSTLMLFMTLQAFAIVRPTKLYVYGFSASFNDSTVYFTEVMELDSAWVDARKGFLYSRENYSQQLKEYLQDLGVKNPTCIISFAKTQKEIDKKYAHLKKKYTKTPGQYVINTLTTSAFRFEAISAKEDPNVSTDYSKAALKAEIAAEKEAKKQEKKELKDKKKATKEEEKAAREAYKKRKG